MTSLPSTKMEIIPRKLDLKFENLEKNWAYGNPFFTAYIASLSSVFPEGEKFFIRSVRHFAPQVTDPKLQQEVKDFIRQEAYHGQEHIVFNNKCQSLGWAVDNIHNFTIRINKLMERFLSPERRLAQTVCLEHLTASFAQFMMSNSELLDDQHPDLRKLLIWHSIEETEHKAVAFDVYMSSVNNRKLLRSTMRGINRTFLMIIMAQAIYLLIKSRQMPSKANIQEFRQKLSGKDGLFAIIRKDVKDFYREDFHPWQHDNSELANFWINNLDLATSHS